MCWDAAHQELLLGDEVGYVYVWNVAAEKCLKCERLHEESGDRAALAIRDLGVSGGEVLVSTRRGYTHARARERTH